MRDTNVPYYGRDMNAYFRHPSPGDAILSVSDGLQVTNVHIGSRRYIITTGCFGLLRSSNGWKEFKCKVEFSAFLWKEIVWSCTASTGHTVTTCSDRVCRACGWSRSSPLAWIVKRAALRTARLNSRQGGSAATVQELTRVSFSSSKFGRNY